MNRRNSIALVVSSAFALSAASFMYADTLVDQTITSPLTNPTNSFTGRTTINGSGNGELGFIRVTNPSTPAIFTGTVVANIEAFNVAYSNAFVTSGAGAYLEITALSETDYIDVTVNGYIGAGFSAKSGSSMKVDGSLGLGTTIALKDATGTASAYQECAAIEAEGDKSVFEGYGNFTINVTQARAYGLWTSGVGLYGQKIYIDGNVNITTNGGGNYGIRADGGLIHITGNLNIDTLSTEASGNYHNYGIRTTSTAKVVVDGDTAITTVGSAAHGLSSGNMGTLNPVRPTTDSGIHTKGELNISLTGASAHGIHNVGGKFDIDGKTKITTVSNAVYASTTTSTSVGVINLNGETTLETSGASGTAIYATGSYATINSSASKLSVTTKGASAHGVYSASGATVNLNTKSEFNLSGNTAHGLYSTGNNSNINVNTADIKIDSTGTGAGHAFYATSRGAITLNGIENKLAWRDAANLFYATSGGKVIGNEAKYLLEGTMQAATATSGQNALIDMTMADSSYYKGKTVRGTGADINLKFKDNSTWENLIVKSTLTSATFESSTAVMSIKSTSELSQMALAEFSGDASSTIQVILIDDFDPAEGDAFQLVLATGEIIFDGNWDFSLAVLGEGLFWDVSTFTTDGTIRVIPEPSTFALLFGLAAIAIAVSRKRKN